MEITFLRAETSAHISAQQLIDRMNSIPYNDKEGIGFGSLDLDEHGRVTGFARKKAPFTIEVYDSATNSTISRSEFTIEDSYFRLDLSRKVIEAYGRVKDVRRLVIVFAELLGTIVDLGILQCRPDEILKRFPGRVPESSVVKLKIRDFVAEKGVRGTYDIKSIDSQTGWSYVKNFGPQIASATVYSRLDGSDHLFQVHVNGKFRIVSNPRKELDAAINSLLPVIAPFIGGE